MTKTTILTATRSIDEIVEEFASITDSGTLRYHQARLTYEVIGSTEGTEAAELKESFRINANAALARHNEAPLSVPGVTNLVNTWKYMKRANVDTSVENPHVGSIAKAAFNLASQSFRDKDKNYVNPAIEAIVNGMDAQKAFADMTAQLKADKKADAEQKAASKEEKQKEADKAMPFDVLVATLGLVNVENVSTYTAEQKSIIRDLLVAATNLVK
jgi:hypothetical protein